MLTRADVRGLRRWLETGAARLLLRQAAQPLSSDSPAAVEVEAHPMLAQGTQYCYVSPRRRGATNSQETLRPVGDEVVVGQELVRLR